MSTRRFHDAKVVNVVDGDTVDIEFSLGFYCSTRQRVRLARIDAPERGQSGWAEANDLVKRTTLNQAAVVDVTKTDKYGRWLAEIYVGDKNISDLLLGSGLAKLYV